jgi:hypothetical protein
MLVEEMFQFIKSSHRHSKIWCRRNYDTRPDERHIRYQDARDLKAIVYTEYNIEGNPEQTFIDLVLEIKPTRYPSSRCYRCDHIKCGMEYRKT